MAIVPRAASPAPIVIDRAPNRADSRGPRIDIMVKVKASGPASRPACSGGWPSPACSSSVSTNMKLPKKKTRAKFTPSPAEKARSRNSGRSSSGSPPRRASRRSQASVSRSAGTQAAMQIQVQAGQPSSCPRVSGTSARARLAETPNAPAGSSRGLRCPRACGTTMAAAISAAAPTGTFTRKIARQPRPSTFACSSSPPRIWPDTKASPMVTPNQASARLRCAGGKVAVIRASTWGTIAAPVSPCSSRAATNSVGVWASPHSREATAKLATPIMNIRR